MKPAAMPTHFVQDGSTATAQFNEVITELNESEEKAVDAEEEELELSESEEKDVADHEQCEEKVADGKQSEEHDVADGKERDKRRQLFTGHLQDTRLYSSLLTRHTTSAHMLPVRYQKMFHNFVSTNPAVSSHLSNLGLDPNSLGTHSLRKGAATFASSGNTQPPSDDTISRRGGWFQGSNIAKIYRLYSPPGDQYLGRILSGLNLMTLDFASLPPHFQGAPSEALRSAVTTVFPHLPADLYFVGTVLLASLLYHEPVFRQLPQGHTALNLSVFAATIPAIVRLKKCIIGGPPSPAMRSEFMIPTGLPPHMALLFPTHATLSKVDKLVEMVAQIPTQCRSWLLLFYSKRQWVLTKSRTTNSRKPLTLTLQSSRS